jgi:Na+/melibiose symporter-like transporter
MAAMTATENSEGVGEGSTVCPVLLLLAFFCVLFTLGAHDRVVSSQPETPGPQDSPSPQSLLSALDDSKVTRFQWKVMFVAGMGFFTDAYDLFVIGVVVALIKPEWHLSTGQISLLNSATLAASAVGAIIFGRIADILGRKRIYGYEVLVLAIGALASAFTPASGFAFLLVSDHSRYRHRG